jgi:hypothetical protein
VDAYDVTNVKRYVDVYSYEITLVESSCIFIYLVSTLFNYVLYQGNGKLTWLGISFYILNRNTLEGRDLFLNLYILWCYCSSVW